MKDGKYVVDSIESGLVKLLYSEDEKIEKLLILMNLIIR